MTLSRFDPGSTSKTLNLSLLRFNERSGSENLDIEYYTPILFSKLFEKKTNKYLKISI